MLSPAGVCHSALVTPAPPDSPARGPAATTAQGNAATQPLTQHSLLLAAGTHLVIAATLLASGMLCSHDL